MAKVFGPGLSIAAKGKVGKGVAFQDRPKGPSMIKRPVASRKSLDQPSAAKQAQRTIIKNLVSQWQALSVLDKEAWTTLADRLGTALSGYHYFMHLGGLFPYFYLLLESGDRILLENGYSIFLE